jgi:hypothetical protein
MNEIALTRGVVGGLPENLDAYPHPGESAPRLTGTFLQAWSNAEQLRVWHQGFLGIQPDLDIVPFERHSVTAAAGDTLIVEQTTDSLVVRHVGIGGSEREPVTVTLAPLRVRREQQAGLDAILFGTEFAKPGVATAHPALRQSRTP